MSKKPVTADLNGGSLKMRAAVMTGTGKLEVREVELGKPKANEVLVKICATAVCHSDLNTLDDPTTPFPQVLGHEGAGIVQEVGPNVSTVKVGDKVALSWVPYCGTCPCCRTGKVNLCESAFGPMFDGTLMDGTTRMRMDGQVCYHSSLISTFAEYSVVPEMSCVKIPDAMPLIPASMIGCGVATGYGASVRAARVDPGSSVAVFGIGGVGVNAIQGARIAGASMIIACDIKDENLELAKKYGATHVLNTGGLKDIAAAVKELTNGIGSDYSIDCTGNTMIGAEAWKSSCKGGTTVVVGAYKSDAELCLPAGGFHRVGKILKGTFYGDVNPFNDFPKISQLYLDKKYDLDSLVIEKIVLADIQKAFDSFHDPKGKNVGRYVIDFQ
ncbi:MAG: Zn-dependent alcohol dehydrogenase [Planctomycetaceae bacterium]|nr:Zn-dependent alcohol dehydrogenase [Planctomycetaceae bacterium]